MIKSDPVSITYFSDVLCIWAYATQIRLEEVARQFGAEVRIEYRFCSVFGNTPDKIGRGWAAKGGYEGFIPFAAIEAEINSGAAFATLAADYQERDRLKLEGSPTFVLNQGRQKLYGNLGYRVIEANVRELLREPGVGEMSWC